MLGQNKSRDTDWDMLSEVTTTTKPKTTTGSTYGSATSRTSNSSYGSSASQSDNGDALKKFGNAKAISSEQYFTDSASDVTVMKIALIWEKGN